MVVVFSAHRLQLQKRQAAYSTLRDARGALHFDPATFQGALITVPWLQVSLRG